MCVLPPCVYVYICIHGAYRRQEGAEDPLELELGMVVSYDVEIMNSIPVLCKSSLWSSLLTHFISPYFSFYVSHWLQSSPSAFKTGTLQTRAFSQQSLKKFSTWKTIKMLWIILIYTYVSVWMYVMCVGRKVRRQYQILAVSCSTWMPETKLQFSRRTSTVNCRVSSLALRLLKTDIIHTTHMFTSCLCHICWLEWAVF